MNGTSQTIEALLRDWLGIGPDFAIGELGLPGGRSAILLAVLVAAAAVFAGYLYSREKTLTRMRRAVLALLRTVVYSLILVFLFGPVLGIEKTVGLRRQLLVMVDRSRSMSIADARSGQGDLADAAVAMGKADFSLPETQEAIARATRSAQLATAALRDGQAADAAAAQHEIGLALAAATKAADAAKVAEGRQAEELSAVRQSLRDLSDRQKGVRELAMAVERDASGAGREPYRPVAEAQEAMFRDLQKLAAVFSVADVQVPQDLQAGLAGVTRIDMVKSLIQHPRHNVLDRVRMQCNVRYYSFGETLEPAEKEGEKESGAMMPLLAADKSSRGGEALREVVGRHRGQPVAGIVLMTDGAFNNEGCDPLAVASFMKEQGVPLYTVGFGLQAPRDSGLRAMVVQEAFFPKDKATVRVQVFSHGYRGVQTELRVLLGGDEMAKIPVELTDEPHFVEATFTVPEGKGGLQAVAAVLPVQAGEAAAENNRVERPVRIINQKIKVLYVEGKPRWEYRYLRVLLLRDPRLDVKFLMTQGDPDLPGSSPQYIARYPDKPEEAFAYDLVILGDVPSWYFARAELERMLQLVRERGGSLLMLAGDRYAPGSYSETPIADLLPVKISQDLTPVPPKDFPVVTASGRRSIGALDSSDIITDAVWSLVRPLHRLPRVEGAKAAATVLVELPAGPERTAPYPLVCWQYVGTGKSMFIGTDQLWRMRYKRGDLYHAKFWGQAIQFLALSRLLGENKRIRLIADRTEVQAGERVEIHANVLDPTYEPVKEKTYTVLLDRVATDMRDPNGGGTTNTVFETQAISLVPVASTPGLYQGSVALPKEGRYVLRAQDVDAAYSHTVDLVAGTSNLEQQEPAMQEDRLRKMAELSGGRYFTVREWPGLAGALDVKGRTIVQREERRLWDHWFLYVLFMICAGGEWALRRRSHLM